MHSLYVYVGVHVRVRVRACVRFQPRGGKWKGGGRKSGDGLRMRNGSQDLIFHIWWGGGGEKERKVV